MKPEIGLNWIDGLEWDATRYDPTMYSSSSKLLALKISIIGETSLLFVFVILLLLLHVLFSLGRRSIDSGVAA